MVMTPFWSLVATGKIVSWSHHHTFVYSIFEALPVNDPLVVADLTERNPNVFYELAIRHAIRKPFVQLIKKGERIPFDVAGARTIQVDHSDLDSVERAKTEIIRQIKSLEADSSDLETPISMSLDLQVLRQSDKPEERSLADLLAAVSEMRSNLAKVEGKLPSVDEVQGAIKNLSARIDEYAESAVLRRRLRFHPMILHEMMHVSDVRGENRYMGILFVASMFRDDFPWVYEVGMEAYRAAKSGDTKAASEALDEFRGLEPLTE